MAPGIADNGRVAINLPPALQAGSPAVTHAQRLSLIRRFIKQCKAVMRSQQGAEDQLILALAGAAGLAHRGILPRALQATPLAEVIGGINQQLGQVRPLELDCTQFSETLCRGFFWSVCCRGKPEAKDVNDTFQKLADLPAKQLQAIVCRSNTQVIADPLFAGWVFQCLRQRPRKEITGVADGADPQSARSSDISVWQLPILTQWFTPDWITKFLVESVLSGAPEPSFLDPACGAGHILVEALKWLVQEECRSGAPDVVALRQVLEQQLFGCDIDPAMAALSGFSIYLACRDIRPGDELPLPKLFHFGLGESGDANTSAAGSLWLGLDDVPEAVRIYTWDKCEPLGSSALRRKFFAVATNPPYLGHRLMPSPLSGFIKKRYPEARFDLYGAFIMLCSRLLPPGGSMAILCQQSFLSITRYFALRDKLLRETRIDSLVHLGPGSFGNQTGEKVNNAIIVARKKSNNKLDGQGSISCRRILDAASKAVAEERGLASVPAAHVKAAAFGTISGAPLSFWCPEEIAHLFVKHPPLEGPHSGIVCTNGLFTCNNKRFVRLHSELSEPEGHDWMPYDKGGGQKWYRTTPYMVYWKDNGAEIRAYRVQQGQSASLPGERFYFQPGITYSYIGTRGFRARLLSPGSIFDIASSSIFSERTDLMYILGFLNSSLARFLLGVLNPTVNFQIGDLRKLPFAAPDGYCKSVSAAACKAVEIARALDSFDASSPLYGGPALMRYGTSDTTIAYRQHVEFLSEACATEERLQKTIDELIFESYAVSNKAQVTILSDPWVSRSGNRMFKPRTLEHYLAELKDAM